MAKSGVKIKELARELGLTSRQLIDRCRERGLWVQNSLTKIPPATADDVRRWFAEGGSSPASTDGGDDASSG